MPPLRVPYVCFPRGLLNNTARTVEIRRPGLGYVEKGDTPPQSETRLMRQPDWCITKGPSAGCGWTTTTAVVAAAEAPMGICHAFPPLLGSHSPHGLPACLHVYRLRLLFVA